VKTRDEGEHLRAMVLDGSVFHVRCASLANISKLAKSSLTLDCSARSTMATIVDIF
jgi:hypothetical protein